MGKPIRLSLREWRQVTRIIVGFELPVRQPDIRIRFDDNLSDTTVITGFPTNTKVMDEVGAEIRINDELNWTYAERAGEFHLFIS